jgi:hypothetical protein
MLGRTGHDTAQTKEVDQGVGVPLRQAMVGIGLATQLHGGAEARQRHR